MKRFYTILILAALVSFTGYAETDPQAREWIEAVKTGIPGKHQGVDGKLKTPTVTTALRQESESQSLAGTNAFTIAKPWTYVTGTAAVLATQTNYINAPSAAQVGGVFGIINVGVTNVLIQDSGTVALGGNQTLGTDDVLLLYAYSTSKWIQIAPLGNN